MTAKRHTVDDSIKQGEAVRKEYRQLYVSFILMLVLTALAFVAVASEKIPAGFVVPFLLFLALVQFLLQLIIFMHLNEKGTEYETLLVFCGFFVAILTVASLLYLIWW